MRRIANYISIMVLMLLAACNATEPKGEFEHKSYSIAYLRSMCSERSVAIKDDINIRGRVIANDKLGELRRGIVIADETGGIELKVDCNDIDLRLPLYSEVELRCTGLHVGREGLKCVLGAAPTQEYVVDRVSDEELDNVIAMRAIASTPPRAERRRICELTAYDILSYIRIDSIQFISEEQGLCWCKRDDSGALTTTTRHLTDSHDTLRVVVDKGAIYANEELPYGEFFAMGVLDYHDGDMALRIMNHQVIPYK